MESSDIYTVYCIVLALCVSRNNFTRARVEALMRASNRIVAFTICVVMVWGIRYGVAYKSAWTRIFYMYKYIFCRALSLLRQYSIVSLMRVNIFIVDRFEWHAISRELNADKGTHFVCMQFVLSFIFVCPLYMYVYTWIYSHNNTVQPYNRTIVECWPIFVMQRCTIVTDVSVATPHLLCGSKI